MEGVALLFLSLVQVNRRVLRVYCQHGRMWSALFSCLLQARASTLPALAILLSSSVGRVGGDAPWDNLSPLHFYVGPCSLYLGDKYTDFLSLEGRCAFRFGGCTD